MMNTRINMNQLGRFAAVVCIIVTLVQAYLMYWKNYLQVSNNILFALQFEFGFLICCETYRIWKLISSTR
jgi:hypothetical protein